MRAAAVAAAVVERARALGALGASGAFSGFAFRLWGVWGALAVVVVVVVMAACERPPVGPPPSAPLPAGRVGPVAFETFTQDRPAIAGKWYDYDPSVHTLNPKPQAWIVRDDVGGAAYWAFRIVTVYDAHTADSGVFTIATSAFDAQAGTWAPEVQWTSSKNIKLDGPVCLRLTDDSEQDCAGTDWQLRFAIFNYFSPLAGIAIGDPGVFVRSVDGTDAFGAVRIAQKTGATALDLASLGDPRAIDELGDGDAAFDGTDWRFDQLGADLPRAGMAIGSHFVDDGFVGRDDVWWLMSFRYDFTRLTIKPVIDGDASAGLRFSFATVPMERSDASIPDTFPDPVVVDVDVPAVGQASYLTLTTDDMQLAADDLAGTAFPYAAPKTTKWDFAVEHLADDDVRILLSPTAGILNATQLGLDETVPPVDSE